MITIKIELPPEIVMQTEREIHITMDGNGVTSNVCKAEKDVPLSAFIRERIDKLYAGGHFRTAETYSSALNSFTRFREGKDIPLQKITQETIKDYEYETFLHIIIHDAYCIVRHRNKNFRPITRYGTSAEIRRHEQLGGAPYS